MGAGEILKWSSRHEILKTHSNMKVIIERGKSGPPRTPPPARPGSARIGSARPGSARGGRAPPDPPSGPAPLGSARARFGSARLGPARLRSAPPGSARLRSARTCSLSVKKPKEVSNLRQKSQKSINDFINTFFRHFEKKY